MLLTSIRTTGIDHTVIHVSDLERSKRFYIGVLGMTVRRETPTMAFLWCGGDQQVALFAAPESKPLTSGVELNHMALRQESGGYEEIKAYLEQNGVEVYGREGDPHCVYFNDPDGHRLQLEVPGEH